MNCCSPRMLFQIPSLNDTPLHILKPNSLVRYRCMIQDMFDPEFYLGIYEVEDKNTEEKTVKSGKYKDVAECGVISLPLLVIHTTLLEIPCRGSYVYLQQTYKADIFKTKIVSRIRVNHCQAFAIGTK